MKQVAVVHLIDARREIGRLEDTHFVSFGKVFYKFGITLEIAVVNTDQPIVFLYIPDGWRGDLHPFQLNERDMKIATRLTSTSRFDVGS